jgi:hypothetical protein
MVMRLPSGWEKYNWEKYPPKLPQFEEEIM